MSELLSNQYSSMFSTPATTINKDKLNSIFPTNETNEPINESNKPTINDINISYEKVERALKSLSNTAAPGQDGISASCYKYGGTKMTEYLVKILRRSVDNSDLPQVLCEALISPIFKEGDKGVPANYRPISLTTHISKIL